jgi:hypothetical protein
MRTLGDMLAKAKFIHRSTEEYHGGRIGHRQWCGSPKMSSAKMRHESMPTVTTVMPHADRATNQDLASFKGNSKLIDDVLTELGHHERIMGHESKSKIRLPAHTWSNCVV